MKKLIILIVLTCLSATVAIAQDDEHLYSTGRLMEIDRCASAWLIKRYIDKKAQFAFFDDGELIARGTAFDTPDARFCRTHSMSTFEILMRHYNISDPALKTLAGAIHDIEINYWSGKKDSALASELMNNIKTIIRANPDPALCLQISFAYFDQLLKQPHD